MNTSRDNRTNLVFISSNAISVKLRNEVPLYDKSLLVYLYPRRWRSIIRCIVTGHYTETKHTRKRTISRAPAGQDKPHSLCEHQHYQQASCADYKSTTSCMLRQTSVAQLNSVFEILFVSVSTTKKFRKHFIFTLTQWTIKFEKSTFSQSQINALPSLINKELIWLVFTDECVCNCFSCTKIWHSSYETWALESMVVAGVFGYVCNLFEVKRFCLPIKSIWRELNSSLIDVDVFMHTLTLSCSLYRTDIDGLRLNMIST